MPTGYFILLTGLIWIPERSLYQKLFYALLASPSLVAITLQPKLLKSLLRDPIAQIFLAFSAWALLSILWSNTESSISSLIKRPIYIFMLFVACALMAQINKIRLKLAIQLSATLMIPLASYELINFVPNWSEGARLIGSGALDNPLLSSHVFGFYCAGWLGLCMTATGRHSLAAAAPLALLLTTLLATGSRSPLLAISLAACWLILCCWNKRALFLALVGLGALVALLLIFPESLLNRGTSYRLEIWQAALEKISLHPWIGYGFDASLAISIPGIDYAFSEPHSFILGVLYYTGVVGAACWLSMHALALWACWQQRLDARFVIAGALVVYGLAAGLAEGGGILARPKEHWFLTWIPLALVTALNIAQRLEKRT